MGLAYHEAGHAVVAHLLGLEVQDACVEPDFGVTYVDYGERELCAERALVALAGPLAHCRYANPAGGSLFFPKGNTSDFAIYEASQKFLPFAHEQTVSDLAAVLEAHWPAVSAVAAALLKRGKLTGAQVVQLVAEDGA